MQKSCEAIGILESRSDITLLLTDVHMPGSMDGLKLAHSVRDRWPPIKIIVVSGHLQIDRQDLPSGSRFFGNPLNSEKIVAEIKSLISE